MSKGEVQPFADPRMYCGVAPSPDGRYVMLAWIEHPFSYEVRSEKIVSPSVGVFGKIYLWLARNHPSSMQKTCLPAALP